MKKFILIILFMILIYSVGGIYYIEYVYKDNNEPVVKNLAEIEGYPYSLNKENVPCKKVKVTIEYENDLGYDKSGTITLVKQDKYYYIVEYN